MSPKICALSIEMLRPIAEFETLVFYQFLFFLIRSLLSTLYTSIRFEKNRSPYIQSKAIPQPLRHGLTWIEREIFFINRKPYSFEYYTINSDLRNQEKLKFCEAFSHNGTSEFSFILVSVDRNHWIVTTKMFP